MKTLIRKIAVVLAIFVVTGLARIPWENSLDRRLTEGGFLRVPPPGVEWKLQLKQEVLSALFGNLRPVMSIYFTLAGMEDWSNQDWLHVESNFRWATDLNPEDADLWSFAAWHSHTNASSWWYSNDSVGEAKRKEQMDFWIRTGADVLKRGIQYHPRSAKLHSDLAKLYLDKLDDPCLAAEHYKQARDGDRPLGFLIRFYPYALALCGGSELEAYQLLIDLYNEGPQHRLPTLIQRIKMLEEKIGVPMERRIPDQHPDYVLVSKYPQALDLLDALDKKDRSDWERLAFLKEIYFRDVEFRQAPLIEKIRELERKLDIPPSQRLPNPARVKASEEN